MIFIGKRIVLYHIYYLLLRMFDPTLPNNNLVLLPSDFDYDQKEILKATIKANHALSKLNGLAILLPNAQLLMSPLLIKESVESNAIENINTTTAKVLQAEAIDGSKMMWPEKEVLFYRKALLKGIEKIWDYNGIPTNLLVELQGMLEPDKHSIRKIPVVIKKGNEVVYTPPEGEHTILNLLSNLEKFVNNHNDDIDPLIKISVIHYQFESIHPFSDGNGRTGRILMMLYLILTKKLEYPVLFLSEYINKTRPTYYSLLNSTNRSDDYTDFILYILTAITQQAIASQEKIMNIKNLMEQVETTLATQTSLDYHKITKILFSYPYISVSDLGLKLNVARQTMTRYIPQLEKTWVIKIVKIGRNSLIYIPEFIQLLS